MLYASIAAKSTTGFALLDKAILALLDVVNEDTTAGVLWKLQYEQHGARTTPDDDPRSTIVTFPPSSLDLAFDDSTLDNVRTIWERIMDGEDAGFLQFPPREGDVYDDDVA